MTTELAENTDAYVISNYDPAGLAPSQEGTIADKGFYNLDKC